MGDKRSRSSDDFIILDQDAPSVNSFEQVIESTRESLSGGEATSSAIAQHNFNAAFETFHTARATFLAQLTEMAQSGNPSLTGAIAVEQQDQASQPQSTEDCVEQEATIDQPGSSSSHPSEHFPKTSDDNARSAANVARFKIGNSTESGIANAYKLINGSYKRGAGTLKDCVYRLHSFGRPDRAPHTIKREITPEELFQIRIEEVADLQRTVQAYLTRYNDLFPTEKIYWADIGSIVSDEPIHDDTVAIARARAEARTPRSKHHRRASVDVLPRERRPLTDEQIEEKLMVPIQLEDLKRKYLMAWIRAQMVIPPLPTRNRHVLRAVELLYAHNCRVIEDERYAKRVKHAGTMAIQCWSQMKQYYSSAPDPTIHTNDRRTHQVVSTLQEVLEVVGTELLLLDSMPDIIGQFVTIVILQTVNVYFDPVTIRKMYDAEWRRIIRENFFQMYTMLNCIRRYRKAKKIDTPIQPLDYYADMFQHAYLSDQNFPIVRPLVNPPPSTRRQNAQQQARSERPQDAEANNEQQGGGSAPLAEATQSQDLPMNSENAQQEEPNEQEHQKQLHPTSGEKNDAPSEK